MILDPSPVSGALAALEKDLTEVRRLIAEACSRSGRPQGSVALLPVVKYMEPEAVRLLHALGVRDAAENTLQGYTAKAEALADLPGIRWHMIGHLQRNKARKAVESFETIHALDSDRLASRLDEEIARRDESAPGGARPGPSLYIEVNVAGESTKGGLPPGEAEPFLRRLQGLPRIASRVIGLMGMAPDPACSLKRAPPGARPPGAEEARPHFRRLRELRDRLVSAGLLPAGAGLSMGMSGDFPIAVEEGATVVRVGSRLFQGLEASHPAPSPGGPPCR